MSPTIKQTAVMLTGTKATPLQGSQYEYLPFDALVQAAIRSDVSGVTATMFSGTDVLLEDSPVDILAAATPIQFPDDYDIQDVAAAGERIGITLRNGNVGTATVRVVVRITPL